MLLSLYHLFGLVSIPIAELDTRGTKAGNIAGLILLSLTTHTTFGLGLGGTYPPIIPARSWIE